MAREARRSIVQRGFAIQAADKINNPKGQNEELGCSPNSGTGNSYGRARQLSMTRNWKREWTFPPYDPPQALSGIQTTGLPYNPPLIPNRHEPQ